MVFQEYREIVTEDAAFQDLDMEIKVTMDKEGKLKFQFTIWNLTQQTWNALETDQKVQAKLGWVNGPVEVVVYGKINELNREPDGRDMKFEINGVDQSDSAANTRISNTWSNKDPATIASDIARSIGLSPQVVSVGDTIQGNWSVTHDQKAKKWLDELVTIAEEKTGSEWEWHGEEGELVFQPKNQTYREAPVLGYDTNLISISDATDADSDTDKLEFEAMLTPNLAKGSAVDVQAGEFTDIWKVETYEHQSNTMEDHLTRGKLVPTDEEYPVEAERAVNQAQQAIDRLGF